MPRNERYQRHDNGFQAETTEDKYSDLITRLESHIESVHDSASFQAYLTMQSRVHRYSWGNTMLIASQRPDATRVAGYRTWQKLGRQVTKGETGIRIIVPMPTKREKDDGTEETRMRFGVGHVFDIAQTEGDPLPELDVPILEGDDGGMLYDQLAYIAHDENIRVDRRDVFNPSSSMGAYDPREQRILVREAPQAQMTKTLAHELGHHFTGMHETYGKQRREHETVAESVAFVVCAHFGLDTADRSVPYIAGWSENRDRFRAVLGTIQGVSATLIDRLTARLGASAPVADALASQTLLPPPAPAA